MNTDRQAEFNDWRGRSEHRFDEHYIDSRLGKEQRKKSGLLKQESRSRNRIFSVRTLAPKILKWSGMGQLGRKQASSIRLTENSLAVANLPAAFNGYRLLHISDPHFNDPHVDGAYSNGKGRLTENMLKVIERADYDLCVLTGDYRYRSFGPIDTALAGLQHLRAAIDTDIVAILGNHDSLYKVPAMEALGITVLLNEHMALGAGDESLLLVGVDDPSYYKMHDLSVALGPHATNKTMCSILFAHSPEIIDEASACGIDAYLCGHTHGGQVCLPGGFAVFKNTPAPRWSCAGAWAYKAMNGYTSVGAGVSIIEARFFCPPEITVHTLTAA